MSRSRNDESDVERIDSKKRRNEHKQQRQAVTEFLKNTGIYNKADALAHALALRAYSIRKE